MDNFQQHIQITVHSSLSILYGFICKKCNNAKRIKILVTLILCLKLKYLKKLPIHMSKTRAVTGKWTSNLKLSRKI